MIIGLISSLVIFTIHFLQQENNQSIQTSTYKIKKKHIILINCFSIVSSTITIITTKTTDITSISSNTTGFIIYFF